MAGRASARRGRLVCFRQDGREEFVADIKTRAGKRTLCRRNAEQNPNNSGNARNFNPNNGNANNNNVNNQNNPLWVVVAGQ